MLVEFTTGARLRAARHMAGFTDPKYLAAKINRRAYGTTVLREIERDERAAGYPELAEIAHACGGLPVEWFTADFNRLAEISDDPRKILAQQQAAALERAESTQDNPDEDRQPLPGEGQ